MFIAFNSSKFNSFAIKKNEKAPIKIFDKMNNGFAIFMFNFEYRRIMRVIKKLTKISFKI